MMTSALRKRLLIFSAVGIGFAAFVIWNFYWPVDAMFDVTGYPLGHDFANVWSAPQIAARWGVPALFDLRLYQSALAGLFRPTISPLMWSYPPSMLLLIVPFGHMPYWTAFAAWTLIGFLAYAAVVVARLEPSGRGAAFLFLLIAPATIVNVIVGQNGFFTAALMLGGVSLIEKRPWLSGILFGLLSAKPQLGLLVPIALLSIFAWRTIAAAALTSAGLVLASLALWGVAPWELWITKIPPLTYQLVAEFRGFQGYMMPSVFASMRDVRAPPELAQAVQIVVSIVVAAATAVFFRRTTDIALRALLLTSGTLLMSPYSFNYDLTAMTGAMLWLLMAPSRAVRGAEIAIFRAVWVLPLGIYVFNGLHVGVAAWLIGAAYIGAVIRIREDRVEWRSGLEAANRPRAGLSPAVFD